MNGKLMFLSIILFSLTLGAGASWSANRSSQGAPPAPPTAQPSPQIPLPAADLNRIPVRVQPQNTQAKLQAAMDAVEKSQQGLKAAVAAMTAYLDREANCIGKSWSAQDMDQKCKPQDTLTICKEKLVAACATGRGSGKDKLWSNVRAAADDLSQKSLAVKKVYSDPQGSPIYTPGLGIPSVF